MDWLYKIRILQPAFIFFKTCARRFWAKVFVDVQNVGCQREGVEIVQVYVSDVMTSVTWVNKALKGFARVQLQPGEKKTVEVELPWEFLPNREYEG